MARLTEHLNHLMIVPIINVHAFCKLVKKERLDNEAVAFAQRLASENFDGEIDGAFEPLDSTFC